MTQLIGQFVIGVGAVGLAAVLVLAVVVGLFTLWEVLPLIWKNL